MLIKKKEQIAHFLKHGKENNFFLSIRFCTILKLTPRHLLLSQNFVYKETNNK